MHFLEILVSFFLLLVASVSAQGWYDSCNQWQWYNIDTDGHTLFALCPTESGSLYQSRLDLNSCVGNRCGNLVTGFGDFAATCSTCYLTYDFNLHRTSTLSCSCLNCNGGSDWTMIDTNSFVTNRNGVLMC